MSMSVLYNLHFKNVILCGVEKILYVGLQYSNELRLILVVFQMAARHEIPMCVFSVPQMKKELSDNESITQEVVGNAHIENYALKMFLYADNEDRSGRFHK